MNTFIDNIAVLAIEQCLIDELTNVFTPDVVADMDENTLGILAAESEDMKKERTRLQKKLDILRLGLYTCTQFHNPTQQGMRTLHSQLH